MCVCVRMFHTHTHKRLTNPRICCFFAWQLMKLFMILSPPALPLPQHTFPPDNFTVVVVRLYTELYIHQNVYEYIYFIEQVNGRQNMLYVRFIYERLLWHLFDYFDSIYVSNSVLRVRDLCRQFQTDVSIWFTLINASLLRYWRCKDMNKICKSSLDISEVVQGC